MHAGTRMADDGLKGGQASEGERSEPPTAALPGPLDRYGPASWSRLGLVALLGLMVLLLILGGGFWQADPVDVPR